MAPRNQLAVFICRLLPICSSELVFFATTIRGMMQVSDLYIWVCMSWRKQSHQSFRGKLSIISRHPCHTHCMHWLDNDMTLSWRIMKIFHQIPLMDFRDFSPIIKNTPKPISHTLCLRLKISQFPMHKFDNLKYCKGPFCKRELKLLALLHLCIFFLLLLFHDLVITA